MFSTTRLHRDRLRPVTGTQCPIFKDPLSDRHDNTWHCLCWTSQQHWLHKSVKWQLNSLQQMYYSRVEPGLPECPNHCATSPLYSKCIALLKEKTTIYCSQTFYMSCCVSKTVGCGMFKFHNKSIQVSCNNILIPSVSILLLLIWFFKWNVNDFLS